MSAIDKYVLHLLVNKWRRLAEEPETQDGSDDARESNARESGVREGHCKCAEDLQTIIETL